MKPQIIQGYEPGRFNADPSTSGRCVRGGSWTKQRVIVVIPAGETIPTRVYLNHRCLIFPPNQAAHWEAAIGMEVGDAYSQAIEGILANPHLREWEYLCTLEHDNLVPQDGIISLIRRLEDNPHLSAISGLYFCKGDGGWNAPHIWGDIKDPVMNFRPQPPISGQLIECYGLSMGFTLYRLSMFKDERIKKPFFRTIAGKEGVGTQDLSFWGEVRKYGYRCAVDCGCLVGHYDFEGKFGPPDMVW